MRTIPLKHIDEENNPEGFDYRNELDGLLKGPASEGVSYEELALCNDLNEALKALPEGADEITLTEGVWAYLCKRLKTTRWVRWRAPMREFIDDILNAPSVKAPTSAGAAGAAQQQ